MGMMGECIKQLSSGHFKNMFWPAQFGGVIAGLTAATIALPKPKSIIQWLFHGVLCFGTVSTVHSLSPKRQCCSYYFQFVIKRWRQCAIYVGYK